jgi:hypothetical protein
MLCVALQLYVLKWAGVYISDHNKQCQAVHKLAALIPHFMIAIKQMTAHASPVCIVKALKPYVQLLKQQASNCVAPGPQAQVVVPHGLANLLWPRVHCTSAGLQRDIGQRTRGVLALRPAAAREAPVGARGERAVGADVVKESHLLRTWQAAAAHQGP